MDKLREILGTKVEILSEKKAKDGNTMFVKVPWVQAGQPNGNKRTYPLALLQKEVARIQGAVEKGAFVGAGDHPLGGFSELKTASHILQKVWLDDKGKGWAEMKIVPTERGKTIMTLINQNAELGVSSRGFGNVSSTGIVQNDYRLTGIDIVMNPSYKEGVFSKKDVYESLEFEEEAKRQKDLEEEIDALEKESYLKAVEDGFTGTELEWEKLHGGNLREMFGVKKDDGKTSVETLTEKQIKTRAFSYYQESVDAGFRGSFDEWKKKYPKMVEQASEEMKVEEKKEPKPKEEFTAKITLEEAQASGFRGTLEDWKKEHPDMELILPAPPQKKVVETVEEESERIFSALKKENPNSSVTLESVKKYLEVEEEKNADKRLRKRAIAIVSKDLDGTADQATVEKMVEEEFQALKEEREKRKLKNWEAYRKLLD